jgi:hypothetical protein
MRIRRASRWIFVAVCLGLASCSPARQTIIRNATGADILLWPLGARPEPLRSGATTDPLVYWAHQRQEALIERGNCLYTYPAPDYSALPKHVRNYKAITVVIHEDMRLSVHRRSKHGVEGPEILVAGFPLKPTSFCGRRGEG